MFRADYRRVDYRSDFNYLVLTGPSPRCFVSGTPTKRSNRSLPGLRFLLGSSGSFRRNGSEVIGLQREFRLPELSIRYQIAREQLDDTFRRSHYGRDIQSHMDDTCD